MPRKRLPINYSTRLFGLLLIAALLVACGNPAAAKKIIEFATGMSETLANTTKAFETIEGRHFDRKVAQLVRKYDQSTSQQNVEFDPAQFKIAPFLPKGDAEARQLVIDGLQEYAQGLKEIMSDEQLTEFDAKTKSLGQKLVSLREQTISANILNNGDFSESDLQVFATAVNAIGRWFIEYKRQKIVRATVETMKQSVRTVSTLLARDLGDVPYQENGERRVGAKGLRAKLWKDYSDIIIERNQFLIANQRNFDPQERRKEIEYLVKLTAERLQADRTLAAVKTALEALPEAHDNLDKAFDEKDTSLSAQIAKLFTEAERIQDFYKSLKD